MAGLVAVRGQAPAAEWEIPTGSGWAMTLAFLALLIFCPVALAVALVLRIGWSFFPLARKWVALTGLLTVALVALVWHLEGHTLRGALAAYWAVHAPALRLAWATLLAERWGHPGPEVPPDWWRTYLLTITRDTAAVPAGILLFCFRTVASRSSRRSSAGSLLGTSRERTGERTQMEQATGGGGRVKVVVQSAGKVARWRSKAGTRYAAGYVEAGAVTIIGAAPKTGKTWLALGLVRAMQDSAPFCGVPTAPGRVLYLTEETEAVFAPKLRRFGLERADLHTIHWPAVWTETTTWPALAREIERQARKRKVKLIVVDTLDKWVPGAEATDTAAAAGIAPMKRWAAAGLAVLIVHHNRKSGGTHGAGLRGSSALAGAVDELLDLQRDPFSEDVRVLGATGRLEGAPAVVRVREVDGYYVPSTDTPRVPPLGPSDYPARPLSVLPGVAEPAGTPTFDPLLAVLDGQPKTARALQEALGLSKTEAHRRLHALLDAGLVVREGDGTPPAPFTYRRVA